MLLFICILSLLPSPDPEQGYYIYVWQPPPDLSQHGSPSSQDATGTAAAPWPEHQPLIGPWPGGRMVKHNLEAGNTEGKRLGAGTRHRHTPHCQEHTATAAFANQWAKALPEPKGGQNGGASIPQTENRRELGTALVTCPGPDPLAGTRRHWSSRASSLLPLRLAGDGRGWPSGPNKGEPWRDSL